jgi:hypothetical protein
MTGAALLAYHSSVSPWTNPLEDQPSQEVIVQDERNNCALDRLARLFCRAAITAMARPNLW